MIMHNPAHPGEILRASYLDACSLSITEAAKRLNVTRQALSDLINGHSGISVGMAYKLSSACGTTAKLWMDLQVQYDLWQKRGVDTSCVVPFADEGKLAAR